MKRLLLSIVAFFILGGIYAQDIIFFTDDTTQETRVLTIEKDKVSYKRFDNLEGPTYVKNISSIVKIKYENGTEDVFGNSSVSTPVSPEKQKTYRASGNTPANNSNVEPFRPYPLEVDDIYYNPHQSYSQLRYNLEAPSAYKLRMMNPELDRLYTRQRRLNGWKKFCNIYGSIGFALGSILVIGGLAEGDDEYGEAEDAVALGIGCLLESSACFIVSACLTRQRNKAINEANRIVANNLYGESVTVGSFSFSPSIGLLSDKNTHEKGVGVGMKVTF